MTHPRTHSFDDAPGLAVDRFFAADVGRPLVIVGNGPSACVPRYDLMPDDPVVFRMNWFFLEDRYYFGNRVDAFFYSISNHLLEDRLLSTVLERDYDVAAIFSPMRVPVGRDGETHASRLFRADLPEFDHWDVIARNAVLSRFMMSRPLPTQGAQVLATALELGFRDITLAGIDMYESHDARYGHAVPDDVRAALQPKDLEPGYENAHSLDRDLDFLDACRAQYPDATIAQIGPSRALADRFPAPPTRTRPSTIGGRPGPDVATSPKISLEVTAAGLDTGVQRALPVAMIDGRRCGYVTFVSGPFHHGARALARSLARVSDVPLLVMCTPSADRAALRSSGLHCIDVPEVFNPNPLDRASNRFAPTYGKLNAFRMTHLDRATYLDSDMIVLRSIDDLFDEGGFRAVCDHGLEHQYDRFNSGLFAFEPSAAQFDDMVQRVASTGSYDGGDQGFLNEYFPDWNRLPHEYNVSKRWAAHHPNLFHQDSVRVLHFVGIKPWQPEGGTPYDDLYRLWFEQLSPSELIDVAESLRANAVSTDRGRPSWFRPVRALLAPFRSRDTTGGAGSSRPTSTAASRALGRATASEPALQRSDTLRRRGLYGDAVDSLVESWPGDELASADHFRRLGTAQVLAGELEVGLTTLRTGHHRYPDHRTLGASLRKTEAIDFVRRITLGLAPTPWLTGIARRASR